jgi:hypothetical protein
MQLRHSWPSLDQFSMWRPSNRQHLHAVKNTYTPLCKHEPEATTWNPMHICLQESLQSLVATLCKTELEMTAAHQPH